MAYLQKKYIMITLFLLAMELMALSKAGRKEDSYNLFNYLMEPSFYKSTIIPAASESSNVSITMQLQLLSIVRVSVIFFTYIHVLLFIFSALRIIIIIVTGQLNVDFNSFLFTCLADNCT